MKNKMKKYNIQRAKRYIINCKWGKNNLDSKIKTSLDNHWSSDRKNDYHSKGEIDNSIL